MVGAMEITFTGNRSDSVSQLHLMISALTDDSVVSQQTFRSWKIAIFFKLVWANSQSPFAPREYYLSSQGFTTLPLKKGGKCSIW